MRMKKNVGQRVILYLLVCRSSPVSFFVFVFLPLSVSSVFFPCVYHRTISKIFELLLNRKITSNMADSIPAVVMELSTATLGAQFPALVAIDRVAEVLMDIFFYHDALTSQRNCLSRVSGSNNPCG